MVNWAKFRHPYLFPIEDQVWTRHSAHRRIVIAANGGGIDGSAVRADNAGRLLPTRRRALQQRLPVHLGTG